MSDEQPLRVKKKKTTLETEDDRICVIHYGHRTEVGVVRPLTESGFATILNAKAKRQAHSNPTIRLDEICSKVPTHYNPETQGHHRWCYSNFTNVARLAIGLPTSQTTDESCTKGVTVGKRSSSRCATDCSSQGPLFPQDKCIFCDKGRKTKRKIEEGLSKCVTLKGEDTIKKCARENQDFLLLSKIDGFDMRAREAMYHESCRRDYIRRTYISLEADMADDDLERLKDSRDKKVAYENAFQFIADYVKDNVINGGVVLRMTMLRNKFLDYVEQNSPAYYNPDYQTHTLKEHLISFFGEQIQFWKPNYRSDLIYSSGLSTGEALEVAFEASESRILEDAALTLRRHIQKSHLTSSRMPWPPSSSYLVNEAESPPSCLQDFLAKVITGKPQTKLSSRNETVVTSIAEDICYATTRGQWKTSKHILLGVTLHLTGSAQIISLLNRFGHCQSCRFGVRIVLL